MKRNGFSFDRGDFGEIGPAALSIWKKAWYTDRQSRPERDSKAAAQSKGSKSRGPEKGQQEQRPKERAARAAVQSKGSKSNGPE